ICRLFKMFNHESPYKYLLRRKMNHAYNRLTNTNLLIRNIADEIGFDDPYHFSKVFKKMFMRSPREIRQMNERKKV
ncbi:MAG: helix-turn-helix transcriptional regulator, partial [Spirochaetales bacterium]|nr:helix-turn-helix transcriptional regulator [Spirochaetales bacterium]